MSARCNIADAVTQMAAKQRDALAVVTPSGRDRAGRRIYARLTYGELDRDSDVIARGLIASGISPSMRAVLMVRPSLEFFSLTFALFKAGIAPVMIDPGLGRAQLGQCLAEAKPDAFIGIPAAHAARIALGWGRPTVRKLVTVGRRLFWGGCTLPQLRELGASSAIALPHTLADDVAAVLFTSGSTGIAKGVVYRHRHFVAQVEMIRDTYGIQAGEIDLPTFPLFALFDPALGMTTVLPEMDFARPARVDPEMLRELIADWRVTNVFGSPAVLATVARHASGKDVRWPTVRRVLSAGAPVPIAALTGMRGILSEEAQIFTPYGATECLPVASIGSREILAETRDKTDRGAGVCVGHVVAPNDVRIIAISDAPIARWQDAREVPRGEIGEITVLGPTTTDAYFERPEATASSKIRRGDDIVHRMGDTGYLDAQGRLWFCGRKSHRVELADCTLFTAPVEEVFNTHPAVFRSALVGVTLRGVTTPVVCIERDPLASMPEAELMTDLRRLAALHTTTSRVQTFLVHPGFPVDIRHNAKIGREQVAVWAQARLP